jgi:type VI secretion system protein ImpA
VALAAIDTTLDEAVGPGNGPDLSELEKLLAAIGALLDREVAKKGGGEVAEAAEGGAEMPEAGGAAGSGAGPAGAVRNRDDVLLLIDKICRYYADYEPSSPIPLILNRTKRLVTMSFLDILKELTPGGVQEFGIIAGIKEEE